MGKIDWPDYLADLWDELDPQGVALIFEETRILRKFPRSNPIRQKGRFRRHGCILAVRSMVDSKVVDGTVDIRGLWPGQAP